MAEPALPGGSGAEPSPSAPGDTAAGPAPASAPAPADQPHPLLAQARAQDLPTRDPVRWRRIDALAQRAAQHSGATRQLLDARLPGIVLSAATAQRLDLVAGQTVNGYLERSRSGRRPTSRPHST